MIINNLSELPAVTQRAIIINYNTKQVTFLALLSALRYANVPVLLIDCESRDGSFTFFSSLLKKHQFDLLSAPLKTHGLTLDWIFTETKDERILLIDSDLEILSNEIITFFNKHIDDPSVFGSGFLHGAGFLTQDVFKTTEFENAYYHERPFMPIALFKTNYVKQALKAGRSFQIDLIENEFGLVPSKVASVLKRLFKFIKRAPPNFFRKEYYNLYPKKVFYDTGGKMYMYLKYELFLYFVNLPESIHSNYVTHFWGTTRNTIDSNDQNTGSLVKAINEVVPVRLKNEYNETVDSFELKC